eukprot:5038171-Pyramimonas_sp.AAC.1
MAGCHLGRHARWPEGVVGDPQHLAQAKDAVVRRRLPRLQRYEVRARPLHVRCDLMALPLTALVVAHVRNTACYSTLLVCKKDGTSTGLVKNHTVLFFLLRGTTWHFVFLTKTRVMQLVRCKLTDYAEVDVISVLPAETCASP